MKLFTYTGPLLYRRSGLLLEQTCNPVIIMIGIRVDFNI